MPYTDTENLRIEVYNKTLFKEGDFSYTGTINGSFCAISGKYQLIGNDTAIRITRYSYTGIKTYFDISFTSILLKLEYRIWFNQTSTDITSEESSSKEIKEGVKKPYVLRNIILELILTLHNRDPPVI